MKEIQIAPSQTVSACTLISIGVIHAILSTNERTRNEAIRKVHDHYQEVYRERYRKEAGEGVEEKEAYRRESDFSVFFQEPMEVNLRKPVSNKLITDLLNNRDTYFEYDEETSRNVLRADFWAFNLEAIGAIEQQLSQGTEIDWGTITSEKLQRSVNPDQTPPLQQQVEEHIRKLRDFEGMTFRIGGHTISVTRRDNTYYSYDSETGILSSTSDLSEMVEHVNKKCVQEQGVVIHYFFPKLGLEEQVGVEVEHEVKVTPLSRPGN